MIKKIVSSLTVIMAMSASAFANPPMIYHRIPASLNVSYIQTSKSISLQPRDKASNYTLSLKEVSPALTYLSDRPNRVVGVISEKEFVKKWGEGRDNFNQDAPNAVLTGIQKIADHRFQFMTLLVELSHPVFNAKNQTIEYDAHVLRDPSGQPGGYLQLHHAMLIIDSACLTCIGS